MGTVSADNRGLRLAARYLVLCLVALVFLFPVVFMLGRLEEREKATR